MLISQLLPDSSEVIRYNLPHLPVCIKTLRSESPSQTEAHHQNHWHEDIEFLHVQTGVLSLSVNGKELLLREGDCLVINSRQMHRLARQGNVSFTVRSIHVDLNLFVENQAFQVQMLRPFFYDMHLPFYLLPASHPHSVQIGELFGKLFETECKRTPSFSLRIVSILYELLAEFYDCFHEETQDNTGQSEMDVLNQMISYIAHFYGDKLQLEDIARSGKVCRNKCCSMFKEYLGLTPIDFLNSYRLSMSKDMLISSHQKISSISAACGFPHQSYYSRLFSAKYGCTPKEYRLQNIEDSPVKKMVSK